MRLDRVILILALWLAVLSVFLERKHSNASAGCMVGAYGLVGLLMWLLWA